VPRAARLLLISVAVVLGLAALGLYAIGWEDRRLAAAVESIPVGTSRDSVVQRLGPPNFEGTDCYVAQFVKFEKPMPRPTAQNCAHWLGPFNFYAVGFNSDSRVVWVAYGDS
jgi:hypothetical protein